MIATKIGHSRSRFGSTTAGCARTKTWFVVDADRPQDQIAASISGHVAAFLRKRGS